MKKLMVAIVAVAAVAALATPSFAGVEFKYGGYFDVRAQYENNITDGKNTNRDAGDVLPLQRTFTGPVPNFFNNPSTLTTTNGVTNYVTGSGGSTETNYRFDDKASWVDQRLRMYFSFVASERLQVVTKWEADTIWGMTAAAGGTGSVMGNGSLSSYGAKQGGGWVGADEAILEMKNVYVDFLIPDTPLRATLGVQGIDVMKGWIVSDDFSAAMLSGKVDPISFSVGYIAGMNWNVYSTQDNIDDLVGVVNYAGGPFTGSLVALWEDAHDIGAVNFQNFNHNNGVTDWYYGANAGRTIQAITGRTIFGTGGSPLVTGAQSLENNQLVDLGLSLGYKTDMINTYINFVQNLGSADVYSSGLTGTHLKLNDVDYRGWMLEAAANFYIPSFTFTVGGFYTSGEDAKHYLNNTSGVGGSPRMTNFDGFLYPVGASHYWSEIVGLGFFDARTNTIPDRNMAQGGYSGGDTPSNLWTASLGAAWQALPGTKLTANYYYIQTSERVLAGYNEFPGRVRGTVARTLSFSHDIGNELDLYLDQDIVDGLKLKLGAAYLWTGKAYTVYNGEDDVWQLGAAVIWAF